MTTSKSDRARLTVPDVIYTLATLAFMGPLSIVFYNSLDSNATELGTGAGYLFQLIIPLLLLVLLSVVWIKGSK